jgi:hypothetical protein
VKTPMSAFLQRSLTFTVNAGAVQPSSDQVTFAIAGSKSWGLYRTTAWNTDSRSSAHPTTPPSAQAIMIQAQAEPLAVRFEHADVSQIIRVKKGEVCLCNAGKGQLTVLRSINVQRVFLRA